MIDFLRQAGLVGPGESPHVEALAGGVSSEIWRVDLAAGPVCVKRALAKLRVAQLWEAPIERNRYEYEWHKIAHDAAPGSVPKVIACGDGLFAMEYLDYPVWKELLRKGQAEPAFAAQVGAALAAIHVATAAREDIARRFPTDEIFHAIRIEPYILATAGKHPDLKDHLSSLATRTASVKCCLVHGDVSPKNILVRPQGPVFLDAECAWYGDPAFDLAFCLNHLLLKCVWVPQARKRFLDCFDALGAAYLDAVPFEDVEQRAASLLPVLLLARVDGKSPVEYLEQAEKERVRARARQMILHPKKSLQDLRKAWQESST